MRSCFGGWYGAASDVKSRVRLSQPVRHPAMCCAVSWKHDGVAWPCSSCTYLYLHRHVRWHRHPQLLCICAPAHLLPRAQAHFTHSVSAWAHLHLPASCLLKFKVSEQVRVTQNSHCDMLQHECVVCHAHAPLARQRSTAASTDASQV